MESHVFTDFYQFSESNAQLDGQFLIHGKHENFHWRTDQYSLGDCQLLRSQSMCGMIGEGAATRDVYQFYFPILGTWSNNGEEFDTRDVLIFEPGCQYFEASKVSN